MREIVQEIDPLEDIPQTTMYNIANAGMAVMPRDHVLATGMSVHFGAGAMGYDWAVNCKREGSDSFFLTSREWHCLKSLFASLQEYGFLA